MIIIFYIITLVSVLFISSITIKNATYIADNQITKNKEVFKANKLYKTPKFKISLIALFLSTYSAYLGTSNKLVDTGRYAWSFLYRYPAHYGSIDSLLNSGTEPGFLLLNMLIGKFGTNSFLLFFTIALLTTWINIYCLFKLNKHHITLILLYLISIYFFQTTYLLKQTLAVSFGNIAFLYLLENNKKGYFILALLASTFHSTALILFPMYFIYRKINSKSKVMILAISFVFIFFTFGFLINNVIPNLPYINQYIQVESFRGGAGEGTFMVIFKGIPYYIISILSLVNRTKLKNNMKNADVYIISSLLYTMSWILTYNFYWASRIGWFFLLPTIVLVPNILEVIKNRQLKILIIFLIVLTLSIVTFRQIIITIE